MNDWGFLTVRKSSQFVIAASPSLLICYDLKSHFLYIFFSIVEYGEESSSELGRFWTFQRLIIGLGHTRICEENYKVNSELGMFVFNTFSSTSVFQLDYRAAAKEQDGL